MKKIKKFFKEIKKMKAVKMRVEELEERIAP